MPVYFFLGGLTAAMLVVIYLDATRYVIPNWLNGLIMLMFVVGVFLLPIDLLPAVGTALLIFVIGLGIFALGLMGGGDVKLMAVLALWTGWAPATFALFFLTAIFGGVMVAIIAPLRRILNAGRKPDAKPLPRFFTPKEPIPYGLAIAASFLFLLWTKQVPPLAHLL